MLLDAAIVLLTVAAMEGLAWLTHKHVMHGIGWGWHASHHAPRRGWFEKNDLYALLPTGVAVALIWLGLNGHAPLQWVGVGMTVYGLLYFVAHDGLVHRRWPLRLTPRRGYLKRLVQAHRLHHAVRTREGAVSFGFLWAPSPQRLRKELQALRERRGPATETNDLPA
ncbi:sterol desaturase family protein [Azohydromonas caseinilytica]|uniref:Beta-carotene hydroxylase n=1 Tax=Azohydromonas caseinilytica TaxID=2728836 RepID=A0A848FF10_9BURK|nr:sterol desaturase family protein [Azohydromonas caseinilytica]NML16853.1 beta-carotene hydroxylase [Azohydromonas caseinilytica]